MPRNLDLTALRSFVTVADSGGVTRAAGMLHLTQSAVSMQLKRLEEALQIALFDRSGRSIALTSAGEQLLGYARRMLELNDEALGRLTSTAYEGEIVLGVPHDVLYPYVPPVLRRFATEFPRMKMRLHSAPSRTLRDLFGRGECDAILTTEDQPGPGGEVLVRLPLVWIGAEAGTAWRSDPLPVAFCTNCIFRGSSLRLLEEKGLAWDMVVESDLDGPVEAALSADLGVTVSLAGYTPGQTAPVQHDGRLPDPGDTRIVLYMARQDDPVRTALADMIRTSFRGGQSGGAAARLTA